MALVRAYLSTDVQKVPPLDVFFGRSPKMALAHDKLHRVAGTDVPVLVQGESGTGKEIFSKLLHLYSRRSDFSWVKVACLAIPLSLIESELFGFEKGAFTGAHAAKCGRLELANRGTLFLDEVGSLDPSVQAKLLQVLQDGSFSRIGACEPKRVDTRIVCAARGDLRQQAEEGTLRLDFFFRINAVTIELPPLRQRIMDLPILIDYFVDHYSREFQRNPKPPSRELIRAMMRYNWPGNIRQLENMIRGYVLIGNEEALVSEMIPAARANLTTEIDLSNPVSLKQITRSATRDLERQIITRVLQANGWSRAKTAKWLKISYRSLLYKLQELQLGPVPIGSLQGELAQALPPPAWLEQQEIREGQ